MPGNYLLRFSFGVLLPRSPFAFKVDNALRDMTLYCHGSFETNLEILQSENYVSGLIEYTKMIDLSIRKLDLNSFWKTKTYLIPMIS